MTRGQMVLVTKDKGGTVVAYDTAEFNGDMYPRGYGSEAMDILEASNDVNYFEASVKSFNNEHYQYEEGGDLYEVRLDELEFNGNKFPTIDFRSYYDAPIGFSDYIYIKNNTDDYIFIVTSTEDIYILEPGKVCGFYFGRYYDTSDLTCDFTKEDIRLHDGLELYALSKENQKRLSEQKEDAELKDCIIHAVLKVPDVYMERNDLYSFLEDRLSHALSDSDIEVKDITHIEED